MSETTTKPRLTRGAIMRVLVTGRRAGALLMNIFERKQEARNPFFRVVELDEATVDPAVWGKNFPLQYDDYLRTVDQQRTRYGGSEALPHSPSEADPRSQVAESRLEDDLRLKTMWAGAFSMDFRKKRSCVCWTTRRSLARDRVQAARSHLHAMRPSTRPTGGGDLIRGRSSAGALPDARKPGSSTPHPQTPAARRRDRAEGRQVCGYDVSTEAAPGVAAFVRQPASSTTLGAPETTTTGPGRRWTRSTPNTEADFNGRTPKAPTLKAQHPVREPGRAPVPAWRRLPHAVHAWAP
jgi:hypothetical protein